MPPDEKDLEQKTSDFDKIPKNLEYKTFHIELGKVLRETKDDQELGVFYGAMANESKDRGNDTIAPDAFDGSLARYKKAKRNIRLFYQHDTYALPIGIIPIKSVEKNGKNWDVKGELNLDTQKGREVYSLMKQGALSDLSIGFQIIDQEWKNTDSEFPTRIIKELELWEVSVVSEPMNPKAVVREVKEDRKLCLYEDELPDLGHGIWNIPKYNKKSCIEDVEHIKTREEFNEALSKSGAFSRSACEFLASRFMPKIDQSKSAVDSKDEKMDTEDEKESEAEESAKLCEEISELVATRKLDEMLHILTN